MSTGEEWPGEGILRCDWTLNRRQNAPFSLAGDSVVDEYGEPFYTIDVSVEAPRHSALALAWSGFMTRRQGRKVTFSAHRFFRPNPANGLITSDAGLSVAAYDREASTITLSGTGSDQSQPTDMVSYFTAKSGYYVGEVVSVDGSVLTMQPPPFEPHASTSNPRRIKALGEFRMDGDFTPSEAYDSWSLNFTASQVIRG